MRILEKLTELKRQSVRVSEANRETREDYNVVRHYFFDHNEVKELKARVKELTDLIEEL